MPPTKLFAKFLSVAIFTFQVNCSGTVKFSLDFEEFKEVYGKHYASTEEESAAFETFTESTRFIEKHNSDPEKTFKLGMNSFADLSGDQFVLTKTGASNEPPAGTDFWEPSTISSAYPDSLDYREEGLVSRVRNQGNCGSCGFFAMIDAIEGVLSKKRGRMVELSKQFPGDCAYPFYRPGKTRGMCDGTAWAEIVYEYSRDVGVMSEEDYPYKGKDNECNFDKKKIITKIKDFKQLRYNFTVDELKAALYSNGPISLMMNAAPREFMYYRSGIYRVQKCDGYLATHALVIVGYGSENGDDYWILKNSWGPRWGEKGFIRIATDYKIPKGVKCYDYETRPFYPAIPFI